MVLSPFSCISEENLLQCRRLTGSGDEPFPPPRDIIASSPTPNATPFPPTRFDRAQRYVSLSHSRCIPGTDTRWVCSWCQSTHPTICTPDCQKRCSWMSSPLICIGCASVMVERLVSRLRLLPPLLILSLCSLSSSLHVVSSSPCRSVCATSSGVGTRTEDVVCLDSEYASTTNGTGFQDCVVCELESTAVDSSNGATDVGWGLCQLCTEHNGLRLRLHPNRQPTICPLHLCVWLSPGEDLYQYSLSGLM